MVSMRCLRSVGLFSSTNEMPASFEISRKRIGGTGGVAASNNVTNPTTAAAMLLRRRNLRLTRHLRLFLFIVFDDLPVFRHHFARLARVAAGPIRIREFEVKAPVVVELERPLQMRYG